MTSLYTLSNKEGSLSTYAIKAGTHRFHTSVLGFTERKSSSVPTKFFLGNPSLLSGRRCYPHLGFAAGVNNGQAPLGFQVKDIFVGNRLSSKRIYNFDYILSQDKFGSYPENVDKGAKNDAENQVAHDFKVVINNPEAVNAEKRNQNIRSSRPSKVAARPKGFIHHLSIAGDGK